MPRSASGLACACATLLLSGCNGAVDYFTDTHGPTYHVNRPIGNSENSRIVSGQSVAVEPLKTEQGNVWPGPIEAVPTLEDLQKMPPKPLPDMNGITPPPLAVTPGIVVPELPHHLQPRPGDETGALTGPLATPGGTVSTGAPPATPSNPNLGITVPNGNGTSTVIAPDGTITTIPTPP